MSVSRQRGQVFRRRRSRPMNDGPASASLSIPGRSAVLGHKDLTPSWVVVGLAMGPAVAIGLARFAYALLLPPMRADLGGVRASRRHEHRQCRRLPHRRAGGGASRRADGRQENLRCRSRVGGSHGRRSGLSGDFMVLSVLRVAAGFTGALAFVCGAGLTSAAAMGGSKPGADAVGRLFAGAGMGVTASALAVPPLLERVGWRGGWLVLGALALAAAAFGLLALRRAPQVSYASAGSAQRVRSPRSMACTLVAYRLFGAGYIAYATFIVAYLRSAEGFSGGGVTRFWSILGMSSVAAAFAWGRILGRLKGGWGTAATLGISRSGPRRRSYGARRPAPICPLFSSGARFSRSSPP